MGRVRPAAGPGVADGPPFQLSLAQWSLHRTLFAGDLDTLGFPAAAALTYGIEAVEYVNVFFKDKAGAFARGVDTPKLQEVTLTGGVKATAFASQAVPGTGEIVLFKQDIGRKPAVFLSNSYKYLDNMLRAFQDEPLRR